MRQLLFILIVAATVSSCHSDYYPDGCRKGSWGAYKDYHGSPGWRTYCLWMEERAHEGEIVERLMISSKNDETDRLYLKIEMGMLKADEDSIRAYKQYAFDWEEK